MYARGNPKTKKLFKEYVGKVAAEVLFSPGIPEPIEGTVYVEGPHYPQPHTWYAQVSIENGIIKAVK
jgi:hypothetical protein